jgi:hypothetical protein
MLQNKAKEIKRSKVDRLVDKALYMIFVIQFIICVAGAMGNWFWLHANAEQHSYNMIPIHGNYH